MHTLDLLISKFHKKSTMFSFTDVVPLHPIPHVGLAHTHSGFWISERQHVLFRFLSTSKILSFHEKTIMALKTTRPLITIRDLIPIEEIEHKNIRCYNPKLHQTCIPGITPSYFLSFF